VTTFEAIIIPVILAPPVILYTVLWLQVSWTPMCDYILTYNRKDFVGIEQFHTKILDPKEFLLKIGAIE
jgi:hypothetical protein